MSKDSPGPVQHNLFGYSKPKDAPEPATAKAPLANTQPTMAPDIPAPAATPPPRPAAAEPSAERRAPAARVVLTVGELTRRIKDLLEYEFPRVWVQGEVSGFRGRNPSGHLYFNLKDQDACIDAKIWSSVAQRMKFQLRDGLSVL